MEYFLMLSSPSSSSFCCREFSTLIIKVCTKLKISYYFSASLLCFITNRTTNLHWTFVDSFFSFAFCFNIFPQSRWIIVASMKICCCKFFLLYPVTHNLVIGEMKKWNLWETIEKRCSFVAYDFQFRIFTTLQANLTHLPRSEFVPGIGLGIGKCPYDPIDNSTAIYVESGNPGGFSALVRDF